MEARQSLHQLDEICEDQRGAMQDWIDALETCRRRDARPSSASANC